MIAGRLRHPAPNFRGDLRGALVVLYVSTKVSLGTQSTTGTTTSDAVKW